MKLALVLSCALASLLSTPAIAGGYAVHGTYLDYGPVRSGLSSFPSARRIPAVLYVWVRGREAHLLLRAPGASCLPEFGPSSFVGPASWGGPGSLVIHVDQRSSCFHNADDARLLLRFHRQLARGVARAQLTDDGREGATLFVAD